MIEVFLSYTKTDSRRAKHIQSIFESDDDIHCYTFERDDNPLQTSVPAQVAERIDEADYFLLLWTKNAVQHLAWLQQEFDLAHSRFMKLRNEGRTVGFIIVIQYDEADILSSISGLKYQAYSDEMLLKLKQSIR